MRKNDTYKLPQLITNLFAKFHGRLHEIFLNESNNYIPLLPSFPPLFFCFNFLHNFSQVIESLLMIEKNINLMNNIMIICFELLIGRNNEIWELEILLLNFREGNFFDWFFLWDSLIGFFLFVSPW
jgi:hypothetical protein